MGGTPCRVKTGLNHVEITRQDVSYVNSAAYYATPVHENSRRRKYTKWNVIDPDGSERAFPILFALKKVDLPDFPPTTGSWMTWWLTMPNWFLIWTSELVHLERLKSSQSSRTSQDISTITSVNVTAIERRLRQTTDCKGLHKWC